MRAASTLLALAALGAVGYWGHHTGWRLPSFAAVTGQVANESEAWCDAHGVPEAECVECNPALDPPPADHGWCPEHGVHQCTICNPELAQLKTPPAITAADRERVQRGLDARPRPENNNRCPLYQRRVQFASREAMAKAGVDVAVVETRAIIEAVAAPAEIVYDPTRVARLTARAPGSVWLADKQVGDPVAAGEVLALIDAAHVGEAKASLLRGLARVELWRKTVERLRSAGGQVVSDQKLLEAEASFREARVELLGARQSLVNLGLPIDLKSVEGPQDDALTAKLQFLGLPDTLTRDLDPDTTTSNLLPVAAPFAGVVVERNVVRGEVVDGSKPLYVVADTRRMWLNLDVRQEDIGYVTPGRKVVFRSDVGGVEAEGEIAWVSTTADEATRTVRARADLTNPDGRLRASTFGTARVVIRAEPNAPAVPDAALQWGRVVPHRLRPGQALLRGRCPEGVPHPDRPAGRHGRRVHRGHRRRAARRGRRFGRQRGAAGATPQEQPRGRVMRLGLEARSGFPAIRQP